MTVQKRIAHLTTVHDRHDVRILKKECAGLATAGYEVHLFVADGKGPESWSGVSIHDIGVARNRFTRMLALPPRMLRAVRRLKPKIVHIHDPELLPVGWRLRATGIRVIYDSHEDVPRAIMSKYWIPSWLRRTSAHVFEQFEDFVARRLSAVVAATPHIAKRFLQLNPLTLDINNYPLMSEVDAAGERGAQNRTVCYIGAIASVRGAIEMVRALEHVDARLILAGPFENAEIERRMRALPGWERVDYRGVVSRAEAGRIMAQASAGLLFFHPEPNHVDAQPNKMFEYMGAGLPVLASDFPLWRLILGETRAGEFADPTDAMAIARLIEGVLADPEAARQMGARGREAVLTRFTWNSEEQKLCRLYEQVLA